MLLHNYQETISNIDNFHLCIMGKDPYPTDPNGVPFCKPDWISMFADNCSGLHVLKSLSVDLLSYEQDSLIEEYPAPVDLFIELAKQGVVFINLSHSFIGKVIRKGEHRHSLQESLKVNMPILKKSSKVVLCGEAWKHKWYGDIDDRYLNIIHPDIRNRNNPPTATCWKQWWGSDSLSDHYALNIKI